MWGEPYHRILLRGPWQCEWLEGPVPDQSDPPTRVRMPISWQDAFGPVSGCVQFSRRFHAPTNIDPDERVVLAMEAVGGTAEVAVNGTELHPETQSDGALRCDITGLLEQSNLLTVAVAFDGRDSEPGGLWKPVAIEIHRTSARGQ